MPPLPSRGLPSRPDLQKGKGKIPHRLAHEPASKVLRETEALGAMLRSEAWELFVDSKIGVEALQKDAYCTLTVTSQGLDDYATHFQTLDKLRKDLETELQDRIAFLVTDNAPISDALRNMYRIPVAVPQAEPEYAWSPFGMDPPPMGSSRWDPQAE